MRLATQHFEEAVTALVTGQSAIEVKRDLYGDREAAEQFLDEAIDFVVKENGTPRTIAYNEVMKAVLGIR